ncbi:IS110 family transposase [Arthrobacter sp. 7749]|nr:IS110 family transposase [Arthrobacter sp. 7749]
MTAVREHYTNIVGADTYARTNTYAILTAATGQFLDTATFPSSPPGLKRATAWNDRLSAPGKTLVAIEGTNSYGSGLTRVLRATELDLCKVRPPRRASRAGRGKFDDIDALAAARTVLGEQVEVLWVPRAEGNRGSRRILLNARNAMVRQDTADRLMLTSLIRTMDLGRRRPPRPHRRAGPAGQLLADNWDEDPSIAIARAESKRLASAVLQFHAQLESNQRQLQDVVGAMAAGLLDLPCVGPVSAAQVLISYSHHGRVRSEAAFAALAGANPIPASTGNKTRHRLNPNGDRQLNRTLYTIARSRMIYDPTTIAYVVLRTAEGKTFREIRLCVDRFIARQLFRKLQTLLT